MGGIPGKRYEVNNYLSNRPYVSADLSVASPKNPTQTSLRGKWVGELC